MIRMSKYKILIADDRLSVHCLRKSYGTNLANLGTVVHTLKELMGHSNIQTTMEYYLFSSDANKKKAVEGVGWAGRVVLT